LFVVVVAIVGGGGGDGVAGVVVAHEVVLVVVAVWLSERSGRTRSKGDCAIFLGRVITSYFFGGIKFNCKLLLEM
jgi:hypothetical protein